MHELSLIAGLMPRISSLAAKQGAKKVLGVKVALGAFAHISAPHLREHFVRIARGTVADGARLEIEQSQDINDPRAQDIFLKSVEIADDSEDVRRLRIVLRGAVQGVGFRPFVYKLARGLGLKGWVQNSAQGVFIEVEGDRQAREAFLRNVESGKPPRASIQSLEYSELDPAGYEDFVLRPSSAGEKTAVILPDIATCAECLHEILDPTNRRYRYPFTNCTHCGPRMTIVEDLPYDRDNTTMRHFKMCKDCRAEYENPLDRRFHAQPNACSRCGPHLELWDTDGRVLEAHSEVLDGAADALRRGKIVALKGIGGFHLLADARNEEAVLELRKRKHREEKPLALMYPAMPAVRADCEVSDLEAHLLSSCAAPIVLLRRKPTAGISLSVALRNPYLGVMLPYSPLHHLLLSELGFPLVATSGNISDEPICTDESEAVRRLNGIADLFLVHDRPIVRGVDDSIARIVLGREMILRRARGYAPLPVYRKESLPSVLAVGAHLKNTVAAAIEKQIFVSQHIGDLETPQAFGAFRSAVDNFGRLYDSHFTATACDLHPNYASTQYARRAGLPVIAVQHHYAHVLACMAENELEGDVLGVAWDGTGYGTDGSIWGGEFLRVTKESYDRVGHFRRFRLPGGEAAVREPRRSAIGLLYEILGEAVFDRTQWAPVQAFSPQEISILRKMLGKGVNAPWTSSAGRLFDAVAAIAGLRQTMDFEGQAAMEWEFALDGTKTDEAYLFRMVNGILDWEPMIRAIVEDVCCAIPVGKISAKFHHALAEGIVSAAKATQEERVVLTGGCFQNKYLVERAVHRLREEGFRPYWHQRIPPNDGGIALGQVLAASRALAGRK